MGDTAGALLGAGLGVCPDSALIDMQMRFQRHSGPWRSHGCHRSRDEASTDLRSFRLGWNSVQDCPPRARTGRVSCLGTSLTRPLPEAPPGRSVVADPREGSAAVPSRGREGTLPARSGFLTGDPCLGGRHCPGRDCMTLAAVPGRSPGQEWGARLHSHGRWERPRGCLALPGGALSPGRDTSVTSWVLPHACTRAPAPFPLGLDQRSRPRRFISWSA